MPDHSRPVGQTDILDVAIVGEDSKSPVINVGHRVYFDGRAALAATIIQNWAAAGIGAKIDSDHLTDPRQLVGQAFDIATLVYEEAEARGMTVKMPPLAEVEHIMAEMTPERKSGIGA